MLTYLDDMIVILRIFLKVGDTCLKTGETSNQVCQKKYVGVHVLTPPVFQLAYGLKLLNNKK